MQMNSCMVLQTAVLFGLVGVPAAIIDGSGPQGPVR